MTSAFKNGPVTPRQAMRRAARLDRMLAPDTIKALAEPTRQNLLTCLLKCQRPCSVTEVAECCALDFSMVSRHLQVMAKAGILRSEKRGRTVWYSADGPSLSARLRALADAIDELTPDAGCCEAGSCKPASPRAKGGPA